MLVMCTVLLASLWRLAPWPLILAFVLFLVCRSTPGHHKRRGRALRPSDLMRLERGATLENLGAGVGSTFQGGDWIVKHADCSNENDDQKRQL